MKHIMKLTIGFLILVAVIVPARPTEAGPNDKITITKITPETVVAGEAETEFTVEVEYELESKKKGIIYLGFNTIDSESYSMIQGLPVKKGHEKVTLKVKVKPVDWGKGSSFKVQANLSEFPHSKKWKALAVAIRGIKVQPQ